MSAEERWAQRSEWAQERGEIEIKFIAPLEDANVRCDLLHCCRRATARFLVGPVTDRGGIDVDLCDEHEDEGNALEEYRDRMDDF